MESENNKSQRTRQAMDVSQWSHRQYQRMGTLCIDNDVIVLEKTHSLFKRGRAFQLDHICVAVVVRGEADFEIDGKGGHVQVGDLFVIIRKQEVRVLHESEDFVAHIVLLSRGYMDYLNMGNTYQMFMRVRQCPIVHLARESRVALLRCFDILITLLRQEDNPYQRQTIYHIIKAYLFEFAYYLQVDGQQPQGHNEKVCLQFMRLLEEHYQTEHSVSFYAEQLRLTPRYVSACIKEVTGRSAGESIAEIILQHACKRLRHSEVSISELSYELGFNHPSAFGKFFRTHMGMGPREWRKEEA